jgi:hypothetical protein
MRLFPCIVLACSLACSGLAPASAQSAYLARQPSPAVSAAQAGIALCGIVTRAAPLSFQLTERDGAGELIARFATAAQAETLRAALSEAPIRLAAGKVPPVSTESAGATLRVRFVTPPSSSSDGDATQQFHALVQSVNDAGVNAGLEFEQFFPGERTRGTAFAITSFRFSVSGSCTQFQTMLDALRPYAGALDFSGNRFAFDPTMQRPLRWSATLKIKSAR